MACGISLYGVAALAPCGLVASAFYGVAALAFMALRRQLLMASSFSFLWCKRVGRLWRPVSAFYGVSESDVFIVRLSKADGRRRYFLSLPLQI